MKAFFAMTAAVLMTVTMLFAAVPENGLAAEGKVTLAEMVKIKKAADEAAQAAKAQAEKAKTAEEKRLAKQLVKQAEANAEVAGNLLEAVKAGEEVSREEAEACAAIAKAVHEATGALAAGNMGKAEGVMGRIGELGSSLPTAGNARAEMNGVDGAGKNQSLTAKDENKPRQNGEPDINGTCDPEKDNWKSYVTGTCFSEISGNNNFKTYSCQITVIGTQATGKWILSSEKTTSVNCTNPESCVVVAASGMVSGTTATCRNQRVSPSTL